MQKNEVLVDFVTKIMSITDLERESLHAAIHAIWTMV